MAITTRFNTDAGVRRLLSAHRDLQVYHDWSSPDRSLEEATVDERTLFEGYATLLGHVYGIAEDWWESTIAAEQDRQPSREDAIIAAFDKRLAGPASHPAVIWVVRSFWLELVGLQVRQDPSILQRPETVLLKWLVDGERTELVRLVACMPYWPIGLDAEGNWC
jgi:hypothetical protein